MFPSWVISALLVIVGCVAACWVGTSLPEFNAFYDYWYANYGWWFLLFVAVLVTVITIAIFTNNFPMLLAIGMWMPVSLPIGMFKQFPAIALVVIWVGVRLFFRLCLTGTLPYIRSFNYYFLACFAWVVIRFLMNPVHKLGGNVEGGSGVSGATPYFMYVLAGVVVVMVGAILDNREKMVSYIRWSLLLSFIIGLVFLICAFIPATAPFFYAWGIYAAGGMGDNIVRFVQMPAYGLFMLQAAACPALFGLKPWQRIGMVGLALAMLILGGNRSTVLAAVCAVPIILLMRRSTHSLLVYIAIIVCGIIGLHAVISQSQADEISPLVRSLGALDPRIDAMSGAKDSSNWRDEVWQSGISKIMESPLVGKGFGNLPKHLDPNSSDIQQSTDFEVILAGGEAHNGFITAAYAFGIPFTIALTLGILHRFGVCIVSGLRVDKHDSVLRDYYALIASMFASYLINIYAAFDMSITGMWIYISIGFILDRLPRSDAAREAAQAEAGMLPGQYGGQYGQYSRPYAYYGSPKPGPKRR